MRDVEIPKWLKELPLAPEFHPTDTEFADPIAYISKIEKEASAYGICKVIPPLPKPSKKYVLANLNRSLLKCPELGDDVKLNDGDKVNNGDVRAVFTTRHQELGHSSGKKNKGVGAGAGQPPLPAVHKQVWQSGEIYTLEQFESKSKTFARSQLATVKEVSPLVIEALFWKASSEKPIYIEYANDVPGSGFGEPDGPSRFVRRRRRRRRTFRRDDQESSTLREDQDDKRSNYNEKKGESTGCRTSSSVDMLKNDASSLNTLSDHVSRQKDTNAGKEMEGTSGWKLSNSPWNLQVIARSPGSLTRFMPDDIPGVTSPMIYIGMLFSWFAWHVEDHELHSLNFLHMGSPKTWYAVPGDYAFTFEEVIRSKAYGGSIDRLAALTLLGEKTTLLSPEAIVASGIPCCRLVQNPGEFVVTFPRAYHIGFSHGFNCGEAANFGTPKWLAVAKEAAVRRAAMNFLPMLSHQHLLYLLTMSFISRVPRSLLPGVRSSRLKDRQKEERERLVKKEFVEDILKENKLLTSLLKKCSSYRTILWDLESLPPSIKESDLHGIAIDHSIKPATEIVHNENANNQGEVSLMSLDAEALMYMEDNDLSSDFQVDSGTLPCVACGVLGFPFMCVLQPSEKVLIDKDCNAVQIQIQNSRTGVVEDSGSDEIGRNDTMGKDKIGYNHPNIAALETVVVHAEDQSLVASTELSEVDVDKGWNMSNNYLRPRIFCLEHGTKIEELLRSRGGARLLVICHSDFKKIKAQAAAIAEEIGGKFGYDEIQLDDATRDDLNLINLAIDSEQEDERVDDWTLTLNVNLRQSVKHRNKFSNEKIQHALILDALFADTTPTSDPATGAVIRQWQARKFRSKRNVSRAVHKEPSESIPVEKDAGLKEKSSEVQMPAKEKTLIQYSRRSFKSKRRDSVNDPAALGTKPTCSLDLGASSTTKKSEVQHEQQNLTENSFPSQITEEVSIPAPVVHNAEAQTDTLLQKEREERFEGQDGKCGSNSSASSLSRATQSIENSETEKGDHAVKESSMANGTCGVATTNESGEANEDVLMQEESELGEPGGSCVDEPATELSDRVPQEVEITSRRAENNPTSGSSTSRSKRKRKREVDALIDEQTNVDGFIRSPCEGLRPRGGKDVNKLGTIDKTRAIDEKEKPTKKKARKEVPETDIPKKHKKEDKKGSYRCDQEGCKLTFKTKQELSMHLKNRCPHEGCGKKFRSHKYAVLHVRVHEDDRPLKCSWKGCKMTFKWAWARTEHLRVHTGERPYKCKVEGCERTFRFVSDYSRHRRKTGHYVNV